MKEYRVYIEVEDNTKLRIDSLVKSIKAAMDELKVKCKVEIGEVVDKTIYTD